MKEGINDLRAHRVLIVVILYLKGKQRQRFGDMGLIELRKTNNVQPQSHF